MQGVNDFTIFVTVVASSFTSGALLHRFGWTGVNVIALPFLLLGAIVLILLLLRRPGAEQSGGRRIALSRSC